MKKILTIVSIILIVVLAAGLTTFFVVKHKNDENKHYEDSLQDYKTYYYVSPDSSDDLQIKEIETLNKSNGDVLNEIPFEDYVNHDMTVYMVGIFEFDFIPVTLRYYEDVNGTGWCGLVLDKPVTIDFHYRLNNSFIEVSGSSSSVIIFQLPVVYKESIRPVDEYIDYELPDYGRELFDYKDTSALLYVWKDLPIKVNGEELILHWYETDTGFVWCDGISAEEYTYKVEYIDPKDSRQFGDFIIESRNVGETCVISLPKKVNEDVSKLNDTGYITALQNEPGEYSGTYGATKTANEYLKNFNKIFEIEYDCYNDGQSSSGRKIMIPVFCDFQLNSELFDPDSSVPYILHCVMWKSTDGELRFFVRWRESKINGDSTDPVCEIEYSGELDLDYVLFQFPIYSLS